MQWVVDLVVYNLSGPENKESAPTDLSVKQMDRYAKEEIGQILDNLSERVEDLEQRYEDERLWWRERLDWFIEWYNERTVEFEDRLRDELTRDSRLESKVKEIML